MGLLRGVARTAVVAGTATAVSNRVSRRQAERWQAQEQGYPQQSGGYYEPPPQAPPPPPPPAQAAEDPLIDKLQKLSDLHEQGVLSDEEFASAKAKLLGA
jgi:hypothetical protein